MSGVSGERDARAERQSSWESRLRGARTMLARLSRPLQLGFAGFVLLHFSVQAYRAGSEAALPSAGFERTPWVVAAVSLLFWLPFTVFGVQKTRLWASRRRLNALEGQARALAVIEPVALALVLAFGGVHGALMGWPLVSGALDAADSRAELVADLSSTWRGVPVQGFVYLAAVGAAAFCAARLTLALLPAKGPGLSRVVIGLAGLAYLLGSYAVIRCGSGSLLP
ncbi:MAG TPA: hypothetical protein VHM25_10410 [Polyangiaceae bacterium]|nr:hypothetical protein [Polyangiaceae bacterium]